MGNFGSVSIKYQREQLGINCGKYQSPQSVNLMFDDTTSFMVAFINRLQEN